MRILLLLRFLCFMALVYLALHAILARLISKPDSKVLWFFSVITDPLTRPVRSRLRRDASPSLALLIALVLYGAIWMLLVGAEKFVK